LQREGRRQRQAQQKKFKNFLSESDKKNSFYISKINAFKTEFNKDREALQLQIQDRKSLKNHFDSLPESNPKIRVCVRKRPMNERGIALLNIRIGEWRF
jgi:hypothetical protein